MFPEKTATSSPHPAAAPAFGQFRPLTTLPLRSFILGFLLLLTGGCALLSSQPDDRTPAKRARLEKLLAGQQYQQALQYLPELAADLPGDLYETEHRQLLRLIEELETKTAAQATALLTRHELAAAILVVEQTLGKIPPSAKLQELLARLHQELERRKNSAERWLLVSRAIYLSSQLQGYRELALLQKPTWLTSWQLRARADALAALRPDLLDCGRQALAAGDHSMAEKCLQLAVSIEQSAEVEQLLTQAVNAGAIQSPGQTGATGSAQRPVSRAPKTRPAQLAGPLPPELKVQLQQEIVRGEINKGYATLARLENYPEAADHWLGYKTQLDQARAGLIAKYLEGGAILYRSGMIAQARETWRLVLELDPDHQAVREKITRADRVLKKLQDLQSSQQQLSPPQ